MLDPSRPFGLRWLRTQVLLELLSSIAELPIDVPWKVQLEVRPCFLVFESAVEEVCLQVWFVGDFLLTVLLSGCE